MQFVDINNVHNVDTLKQIHSKIPSIHPEPQRNYTKTYCRPSKLVIVILKGFQLLIGKAQHKMVDCGSGSFARDHHNWQDTKYPAITNFIGRS